MGGRRRRSQKGRSLSPYTLLGSSVVDGGNNLRFCGRVRPEASELPLASFLLSLFCPWPVQGWAVVWHPRWVHQRCPLLAHGLFEDTGAVFWGTCFNWSPFWLVSNRKEQGNHGGIKWKAWGNSVLPPPALLPTPPEIPMDPTEVSRGCRLGLFSPSRGLACRDGEAVIDWMAKEQVLHRNRCGL